MNPSRAHQFPSVARHLSALLAGATLLLTGLSSVVAFHQPVVGGGSAPVPAVQVAAQLEATEAEGHLLISEVMTGGASASDEFIELYNPGPQVLPLEGLEVTYVTASGGTITRKASWASGAPSLPAGAHVLIANEAGAFAAVADLTYTNGLAATGGSVAIRIFDASSAVDAVGWGNATSTWLEGQPAAAAAAGHSLERLPGGSQGSSQDTNQNLIDFIESATPDPQNSLSPPIPAGTPQPSTSQSPSPTPSPTSTAAPTLATPTPVTSAPGTATPSPSPQPMTIAAARAMPDGTTVTVQGTTLSESGFTDGGGYLADASGGIAVLLAGGSFDRGQLVTVTGVVDDRFSQRTVRTDAAGVVVIGPASEPEAQATTTGAIGESLEGELVEVAGAIASAPTTLTSGIAVDLDDGSGVVRLLVSSATGIDTSGWARGATLRLRGVMGQRDSSGSGLAGYRIQPRDPTDVITFAPPATPTPVPSGSGDPSPTPPGNPSVISIAAARSAPFNSRVIVRGIVTLPSDLAGEGTAAIQDSSGAILLRLSDESGDLELGELVQVFGTRSTKAGMETIRIVEPPRRLGHQAQPDPRRRATASLGEAEEAMLVVVRGEVTLSPRRTSAENIYFDVDDGSGPIRVFVSPRSGASAEGIVIGSWVEVTGVLGQETTGSLPDRGYRIWPRIRGDLRIVAAATGAGGAAGDGGTGSGVTPAGGVGAAPSGSGSSGEPVVQQGIPRLAAPVATHSPAAALPSRASAQGGDRGDEGAPVAATAGLLALGGLLLSGAGGMVLPPGRAAELLRALRDRFGQRTDPEPATTAESGPATPADTMPTLVPLTVLEGVSSDASERVQRGPRADGERILPPT